MGLNSFKWSLNRRTTAAAALTLAPPAGAKLNLLPKESKAQSDIIITLDDDVGVGEAGGDAATLLLVEKSSTTQNGGRAKLDPTLYLDEMSDLK